MIENGDIISALEFIQNKYSVDDYDLSTTFSSCKTENKKIKNINKK